MLLSVTQTCSKSSSLFPLPAEKNLVFKIHVFLKIPLPASFHPPWEQEEVSNGTPLTAVNFRWARRHRTLPPCSPKWHKQRVTLAIGRTPSRNVYFTPERLRGCSQSEVDSEQGTVAEPVALGFCDLILVVCWETSPLRSCVHKTPFWESSCCDWLGCSPGKLSPRPPWLLESLQFKVTPWLKIDWRSDRSGAGCQSFAGVGRQSVVALTV